MWRGWVCGRPKGLSSRGGAGAGLRETTGAYDSGLIQASPGGWQGFEGSCMAVV